MAKNNYIQSFYQKLLFTIILFLQPIYCREIDVLLRAAYLLTKLSSINAELQSVENEIIKIHKSDDTKENRVFNKILKEEINTLN